MSTNVNYPPYNTWVCLVKGAPKQGSLIRREPAHPFMRDMTDIEKERMLVLMTRVVCADKILNDLAETNEAAVLKIFTNLFDAYYEWLNKDFEGISSSVLAFILMEKFPKISYACAKHRNYSKDFIYSHLNLIKPRSLRSVRTIKEFEDRVDATIDTLYQEVPVTEGLFF